MKISETYNLGSFNDYIFSTFGEHVYYNELMKMIDEKDVEIANENVAIGFDFKEYEWIDKFKSVINSIKNIFANPRRHIKYEQQVVRQALVAKITKNNFNDTARNSTLWKTTLSGRLLPEFAYADIAEDDVAIYENKFIVGLIEMMLVFISRQITSLGNFLKSLSLSFGEIPKVNSNIDVLKDVNIDPTRKYTLLTTSKSPYVPVYKELLWIQKNCIKFTDYDVFKACKKSPVKIDMASIYPTNILMQEPDYNNCYLFWEYIKRRTIFRGNTLDIKQNEYTNFAIVDILHALHRKGFAPIPKKNYEYDFEIINRELKMKDFKLVKDNIIFKFTTLKKDELLIDVEVLYATNKFIKVLNLNEKRHNTTLVKFVVDKFDFFASQKTILSHFNGILTEKPKDCTQMIIFTPIEDIPNNNTVYSIYPTGYLREHNIGNLLDSMTTILEGDEFIYSTKCPCCGSRMIFTNEVDYECTSCGGIWTLLSTGKVDERTDLVWIKKFGENQG